MPLVYLTEQGSVLTRDDRRIFIKKNQKTLGEIKTEHCSGIVLFGNIQISAQVMTLLFSSGISTTYLTCKGKIKGQCVPIAGKNIPLRHAQFEFLEKKECRLALAKKCILQKMHNTKEVLKYYHRLFPDIVNKTSLCDMEQTIKKAPNALNRDQLMGYEGFVAKTYFAEYAKFFKHGIKFPGREYFPACDPVNALLSLSYTLVGSEIFALLQARGLDPYLGFLHEKTHSRPSLSLDLLEPFRQPIVDRLVLKLFNRKEIQEQDFMSLETRKGVFLKQESLKVFLKKYDTAMNELTVLDMDKKTTFREKIKNDIENFTKVILSQSLDFSPFIFQHR